MYETLEQQAIRRGCEVVREAPLCAYTSFHIGGPATLLITPPDAAAAAGVLADSAAAGISVTVIGNGSNLLVSDEGLPGVVLHIGGATASPVRTGNTVRCFAGLPLKQLCRFARDEGLAGLEPLYGIPGTVGGGVYMNAGAYGGAVADTLESVTVADRSGAVTAVPAQQLALSYRHSALMENDGVVLTAVFRLIPGNPAEIGARMEEYLARRRDKQPLEYPSAGSFFKRPPGQFAGALIEQCGQKGRRNGDAQISEKHAGFLINRGHATCGEVLLLMEAVQQAVREQTGVQLEPEVRLLP